jgi:acetylornithine deacetylase/succinyl-diaminopimelate desuccinylase-like protein
MPSWRNKPANREYLDKRYTPEQQQALYDAARGATRRLYRDVLRLWRTGPGKSCRRHRRCLGDPAACFKRGRANVSQIDESARVEVIARGPRRISPATHTEWIVRGCPPSSL